MSAEADRAKRIAGMHRRIGRNLLRFQEIEHGLKLMMPYIHPEAHKDGLDGFKRLRAEAASGTLGGLATLFKGAVTPDPPDIIEQRLRQLVDARNDLVHNFLRLPQFDWLSPDSIDAANEYLDKQFAESEFIHRLIRETAVATLREILASPAYTGADLAESRERLETIIPADVEIVSRTDPARTHWPTTRIVRLLKQAEEQFKSADGMTHLSNAGSFIRKHAPDFEPKFYGVMRLVDVLMASKLFHIDAQPFGDSGAFIFRYRSLALGETPIWREVQTNGPTTN